MTASLPSCNYGGPHSWAPHVILSPLLRRPFHGGAPDYLPDLYLSNGDLVVWFMGRYERGTHTVEGDWLFAMPSATFRVFTPTKAAIHDAYARARVAAFRGGWYREPRPKGHA